jgi:ribosomal 50S subunit-associated protein YjgA (DUF615 family)
MNQIALCVDAIGQILRRGTLHQTEHAVNDLFVGLRIQKKLLGVIERWRFTLIAIGQFP